MPALSVVICTVNRPDMIGRAVESVLSGGFSDIELVVVDQSSGPETAEALHQFRGDSRLDYVHSDRVGLSAAYNAGIAATQAELLAFTDDDCVAPPDWAEQVIRALSRSPEADLLYGQVQSPPDFDTSGGVLPVLEFSDRRTISRPGPFRVFGMGANFAARRSLFQRLGGFDEVLGGGGPLRSSQDFDLQYRAYRAGAACLIEPDVRVFHYGLREHARWDQTLVAYGEGDGGFYMKHIRCGDMVAARLFGGRVAGETARTLFKPVLGRTHSSAYLRGMLAGAWHSFRHPVNRPGRVYLTADTGRR